MPEANKLITQLIEDGTDQMDDISEKLITRTKKKESCKSLDP